MHANLLKGSLFAIAAFFCMAVFGEVTKAAATHGDPIWVSFITYLTGTIAILLFILPEGFGFLKTEHPWFHLGRGIFGTAASFLYMVSMHSIPIVNATLLFNTAPIFIPILAIIFLKVRVSKYTWLAIALGFVGITIIIKPSTALLMQSGNLIGLAAGIALAVAYLLIKLLTPTDPGRRIIFYYLFIGTCLQLPLLWFSGPLPILRECLLASAAGICLTVAQVFLVRAYSYAAASEVGVYQYTSIVFVGILDWALWGVVPPMTDLLGVALVVLAGVIIIRSGNNQPMPVKR